MKAPSIQTISCQIPARQKYRWTRMSMGTIYCAIITALTACNAVGPNYHLPPQAVINRPEINAQFVAAEKGTESNKDLPVHWWHLYQDDVLNNLIEKAFVANADLRVAAANLRASRAIVADVEHEKIPKAGTSIAPGYGRPSAVEMGLPMTLPDSGNYDIGIKMSYQVDLFGKIARAIESAKADDEATAAAYDMVKITVAADTAHAYADLCAAGQQMQVQQAAIDLQERYTKSLADRIRIGRGTALDMSRSTALLAQIKSQRPSLQAQQQVARYRLAALLGEAPGSPTTEHISCNKVPQVATLIPVGNGQQLMQRRPDIRKAERSLASATAKIGVATADLYPQIQFGGSIGSTGLLPGFGNGDAFRWEVGPLISWSFPATSSAHIKIAYAEAGSDAALAKFDATVLAALKEADSALTVYARELDKHQSLATMREQNALSVKQAERLFQFGRIDFFSLLDARRALVNADNAMAASDAALANDQVNLFLSLGGGWEGQMTVTSGITR